MGYNSNELGCPRFAKTWDACLFISWFFRRELSTRMSDTFSAFCVPDEILTCAFLFWWDLRYDNRCADTAIWCLIGAKIQLTIITLNFNIAPPLPLILRSHSLPPLLLMIHASSDGNRSHHRHPRRCRQPFNSVPLIDAHSRGGGVITNRKASTLSKKQRPWWKVGSELTEVKMTSGGRAPKCSK